MDQRGIGLGLVGLGAAAALYAAHTVPAQEPVCAVMALVSVGALLVGLLRAPRPEAAPVLGVEPSLSGMPTTVARRAAPDSDPADHFMSSGDEPECARHD